MEDYNEFKKLKENNQLKFEVIIHSNKYEEIIMYFIMSKNVSEKEFINNILIKLDKKYFDTLVKLSCCQCYCESKNDLINFLLKSYGKYYFNNNGNLPNFLI